MTATGNHQPSAGPSRSQEPIRYGRDEHGRPVVLRLAPTGPPHMFVTGGSGSGLTSLIHVIARAAAARGLDTRVCSPKAHAAQDLGDVPGLTLATGLPDVIQLIEDTEVELRRRHDAISAGETRAGEFRHILLAVDDSQELLLRAPGLEPAIQDSLDLLTTTGRQAAISVLAASHILTGPPGILRDQFGTRVVFGHTSRAAAAALFGDPDAGHDVPAGVPGAGTVSTEHGPVRFQAGKPGCYYMLTTTGALRAPGRSPTVMVRSGEARFITADPRLVHPSQMLDDPDVAQVLLRGTADGAYCLARLAPRGPVTASDDDLYAECADGWLVEGEEPLDRLLGPQAQQIIAAVRTADQLLTSDGYNQAAAAYVDAVNAAHGHGYTEAERAAADALDSRGSDGWWWVQGAHGPEITALAARDLIGTGTWTQEKYDLLTRPWLVAFGWPIHPGDAAATPDTDTEPGDGEPDYAATYAQHWRTIVEDPDGTLNRDQVMRELADYSALMGWVTTVYDEITGGKFSKPETAAHHVIAAALERIADMARAGFAGEDDVTGEPGGSATAPPPRASQ